MTNRAYASLSFHETRGQIRPRAPLFSPDAFVSHTNRPCTTSRRSSNEDEQPAHPIDKGVQGVCIRVCGPVSPRFVSFLPRRRLRTLLSWFLGSSSHFTEPFLPNKLCPVHRTPHRPGIRPNHNLAFRGGPLCGCSSAERELSIKTECRDALRIYRDITRPSSPTRPSPLASKNKSPDC